MNMRSTVQEPGGEEGEMIHGQTDDRFGSTPDD